MRNLYDSPQQPRQQQGYMQGPPQASVFEAFEVMENSMQRRQQRNKQKGTKRKGGQPAPQQGFNIFDYPYGKEIYLALIMIVIAAAAYSVFQ